MDNGIPMKEVFERIERSHPDLSDVIERADMLSDIIGKLTRARIDAGLSQRQLAEMCGLKQAAIARMETMQVIPRLDTLIKVAHKLNLVVDLDRKIKQSPKVLVFPNVKPMWTACWNVSEGGSLVTKGCESNEGIA